MNTLKYKIRSMAAKEKINLLEVIPCRSEHITDEREGETIVLSFLRFK